MARQRRYIPSGGLAFTEKKEMKKLSRLAAKGWILESFAMLGYYVRKDTPQQLTYAVDYNKVNEHDQKGYVEIFEASGWTKVCSTGDIHIFSAPAGTKPIYSDTATNTEKYKQLMNGMKPLLALPLCTIAISALYTALQNNEADSLWINAAAIAAVVGTAISIPLLMTYLFAWIRMKRASVQKSQ